MAPRNDQVKGFAVPEDDDALVAWLERKREVGRKSIPERQMKLNLAFVLGHQWLVWDEGNRKFRSPNRDPRDPNQPVRITANKIGGLLERQVAKVIKNAPIPETRPVSDENDDVAAARVGTRILSHELERFKWQKWLASFLFWPGTLGWSYAHVWWDAEAGDTVGDIEGEAVRNGEVALEMIPAFELAVDPSAKSIETARWAIRTVTMTREAAWEQWGITLPGDSARSIVDEVRSIGDTGYSRDESEWVSVHQLWVIPSRAAPQGMVVTWSGQQIVEKPKPFPYKHNRLPFIQCDWLPGIGTREGRTWVNDAIPLQVDYNDARSREATIRRTLTPKIVAPAGSIDPGRLTSRVEVITYMPTGAPPQVVVPDSGWMNQYEQGMGRADAEMGQRAGINEASQGTIGSSAPAAAILALQEADDTKLALTAVCVAEFTESVGWHVLQLVRQFWTEERTVRAYSEESGALDVFQFQGADVGQHLDVHVSSESALPRSKSARVQLLMELFRAGVISDPQTLIRMLDLPGTDFMVREMDLDTRREHRELAKMLKGEVCQVSAWDNHDISIRVINNFRKTPEYEALDDEIKAIIDAHAAVHESLLLAQAGVPVGQPQIPGAAEAAGAVRQAGQLGDAGYLMDPLTGATPNPLAMASGQVPNPVTDKGIYRQANIGQGAGSPGRVPGIPADNQAASMGN